MNILITGGTGFVGENLTKALHEKGHHTYILTRSPEKYTDSAKSTFISYDYPVEQLPVIHAVINLAGESLFGYWSEKKKESILNSRIDITQKVIDIMKKLDQKPEVFISGSAVGFYGTSEDLIFTEETSKPGGDFLAKVTTEWENVAKQAEEMGIRTVYTRFGVILGEEGALKYMSLPVKMFVGGKIGNGEQWLTWVHIEDVVKLLQYCLFNKDMIGPINVATPNPKRNKDFTKILANVLKRSYWLPIPAPLVRLGIGEMSLLIAKGQYVLPKRALDQGFQFSYPYLKEALKEIKP
ncbi:TIGR01777 family oxidoreductase [Virgibacillus sp. NKC19-16]|uniref:TIGR01777 family oxidoreductase n=1 Tax=Virgibacillus salidurans TaxID=2831673 RepID=UPI001F18333A|nr:TIGR01777 family oxidoreductase [Virgibacillus sp. NKC19-16]UJL47312.1 TIGR01777 family oxidoreductase [Virgibacillus sp. NKC19-16]